MQTIYIETTYHNQKKYIQFLETISKYYPASGLEYTYEYSTDLSLNFEIVFKGFEPHIINQIVKKMYVLN